MGAPLVDITIELHAVEGNDLIFPATRLLNANVVADGEAELLNKPGYVRIIFPEFGMELLGVNPIVCIEVIGTNNTSAPAPPPVPRDPVK